MAERGGARVPLCDAYPYVERENRTGTGGTDLDERRARMVLVGYDEDSRTYKLYDPTNDRIYSRRYADVIFDENPKMQCPTPTFKTATPLDVQLFHTFFFSSEALLLYAALLLLHLD